MTPTRLDSPCDFCAVEHQHATAGLLLCEIHARMIAAGIIEIENQAVRQNLIELLSRTDN